MNSHAVILLSSELSFVPKLLQQLKVTTRELQNILNVKFCGHDSNG